MSVSAAAGRQAVVPMISYADGPAAMDWLADVFGFVQTDRMVDDGVLGHGEMLAGNDDVDRHFARARDRGATILSDPQDNPYGRAYRAEDVEGHRWMFLQTLDA
ncbi:MAG TPA: VOC family protein [Micromonosporaceae bacterium]